MIFLRESASLCPSFFLWKSAKSGSKTPPSEKNYWLKWCKMYSAPFSSKKTPIIMYKQINQIIGYDFRLFYFITATTTQKSSKFVLKQNKYWDSKFTHRSASLSIISNISRLTKRGQTRKEVKFLFWRLIQVFVLSYVWRRCESLFCLFYIFFFLRSSS